ncbi:MAG: M48 family metalloprotease [Proteobacteria bacterium]|nr:M48 family metalloprotease [Pseudomonadota bacterium]
MRAAHISRRSVVLGFATAAVGGCQTGELTLSSMNPLGGTKYRRQIDEALANPRTAEGMEARRNADLGDVLGSGISGFASTPLLESYVNEVLNHLVEPIAGWQLPLRAYVMADLQPGAFAYSSGAIFVTDGLLRGLRSEDELAFVLGHEIGHIAMRHHTSDWIASARRYSVLAAETGFALQGAFGGQTSAASAGWLTATYAGAIVSRDFVSPNWTRGQEDQADRFSIDLMVRAGFNIEAAYEVMDLLKAAEQNFGRQGAVEYTALEEALQGQSAQIKADAAKGNLLASPLAALGDAISDVLSESRKNHRPVAERVNALRKYVETEYDDAPAPLYRQAPLMQAMSSQRTKTVLDRYDAVRDLVRNSNAPRRDPRARARLLAELAAGLTATDSFVITRIANLRVSEGPAIVERVLAPALSDSRPGLEPFYAVAELHKSVHRYKEGLATLERTTSLYGEPSRTILTRIALQAAGGDAAAANASVLRCQLQKPELAGTCRKVAQMAG